MFFKLHLALSFLSVTRVQTQCFTLARDCSAHARVMFWSTHCQIIILSAEHILGRVEILGFTSQYPPKQPLEATAHKSDSTAAAHPRWASCLTESWLFGCFLSCSCGWLGVNDTQHQGGELYYISFQFRERVSRKIPSRLSTDGKITFTVCAIPKL